MKPHEERADAEKKELDGKIEKLKAFLSDSTKTSEVTPEEINRLHRQFAIMEQYSAILAERIKNFRPPEKAEKEKPEKEKPAKE